MSKFIYVECKLINFSFIVYNLSNIFRHHICNNVESINGAHFNCSFCNSITNANLISVEKDNT